MDLPELLRKSPVKNLIRKKLNTLPKDAKLKDAIASIKELSVSYCAVVDADNKFLGLITERDITQLAGEDKFNENELLENLMQDYEVKVMSTENISSVIKKMYKTNFKHVPIMDSEDPEKIIGVVSARDFVYHLIEYFPETVYNVLPGQELSTDNREGA